MKRYIKATVSDLSNESRDSLVALAKNPTTSQRDLVRLAQSSDSLVRNLAIANPSIPGDILQKFASNGATKAAVACNPNTPSDVLAELSSDPSSIVRMRVAENPATPINILVTLADDYDDDVVGAVAKNPNTPEDIRKQIINNCIWETEFRFYLCGARISKEDITEFKGCFNQAVTAQGFEPHGIDYDPDDVDTYDIIYAFSQWIPLESVSQAIINKCLADLGEMGYHQYAEAEDLYC